MVRLDSLLAISPLAATDLLDAGLLTAFFTSILFVVGYSLMAPWWEHKVGWSAVMLDITLGLVLLPTSLHLLFGMATTGLFFTWYRCLSLFAVSLVTLWRLELVRMAQAEMVRDVTSVITGDDSAHDPHEEDTG